MEAEVETTSQTKPLSNQQTFDFDAATLERCVAELKPPYLQVVFRGLLLTAANHPRLVTDIDVDGYVLLSATMETLATAANLKARWYQINVKKLKHENPEILVHSLGINTMSDWMFNLKNVLPQSAIDWFIDKVKSRDQCAPHDSSMRPALRGALPIECAPQCAPHSTISTSMCLVLNEVSLANLATLCEKSGIAMSCSGASWDALNVDPDGLRVAEIVDAIYELATVSHLVKADPTNRNRFFTMAAISSRKDSPWLYFRRAITEKWFLTTYPKGQDAEIGRKLRRQADERKKLSQSERPTSDAVKKDEPAYGPLTAEEKANLPFMLRVAKRSQRPDPVTPAVTSPPQNQALPLDEPVTHRQSADGATVVASLASSFRLVDDFDC